jgi:hypothetical protein
MGVKELRQWQDQKTSEYCPGCKTNCCANHSIMIHPSETQIFTENKVPIYDARKLDFPSYNLWHITKGGTLKDRKGNELNGPALVRNGSGPQAEVILYSNEKGRCCPFYEENTGCKVHEDKRRPSICKEYPIFVLEEAKMVNVKKSCKPFSTPENKSKILELLGDGFELV